MYFLGWEPTLNAGIKGHVKHSPTQGIGGGLSACDDELTHRVDQVLFGVWGTLVIRTLFNLIEVGINVMAWRLADPTLCKSLYDAQEEGIDFCCVLEELLVLAKGQVLDPGEGIVQEGPPTGRQLHILTEDLDHVLEVPVVVREALAKDDEVGDVGDSVRHQMFGV